METYTNALINETSPYLLQHAHNPVDWVPWTNDVFERAKKENKLVLISVGYSACHWCHVMEHECFEDEEVAALMNKFFINVKVDREERPDVDQVYMTAVQLMTNKGGWPLNCFTLADGRPVYGGTYFPKEQWMHILKSLHHAQMNEADKLENYAQNLHKGIKSYELISQPEEVDLLEESKLKELVQRWSKSFDLQHGGTSRAPKFPLPSNFEFLLDYAINAKDESLTKYVEMSLDRMAMGGIYDQIGGGFSRYSVDMLWKVPHFEKMLYDNGQLLSLYSTAYAYFKKPLYKRTVYHTIEWLEREMISDDGAFYSALDADSEGVEGKFYVWTDEELKKILDTDYPWVKGFYEVNQRGYWEDENYILLRSKDDAEICQEKGWSIEELEQNIERVNDRLLSERSGRVRPGTDDKCLTSWNALTLKALCDASAVFDEPAFLALALKNARWLTENQLRADGGLWRNYKNGTSNIEAFLEDYAHTINAFVALYEVTLDESWLHKAKDMLNYTIAHFFDEKSGMFFFTSADTELIARKMEINDNVLPASNSVMARNLFYIGTYFHHSEFKAMAKQMLCNVYNGMEMYGSGYSNWGILLNHFVYGLYEITVVGTEATTTLKAFRNEPIPKVVFAGAKQNSTLPILADKKIQENTLIYICTEGTCFEPTTDVSKALQPVIQ